MICLTLSIYLANIYLITIIVYPSKVQQISHTSHALCKLALGYTKLLVIIFGLKAASIYIRDIAPQSVFVGIS